MIIQLIAAVAATTSAGSLDGLPSVVGPGDSQPLTEVIPAGDLDGDGLGDLVIGSPFDDTAGHEAGGVYIIYEVADLQELMPVQDVAVFLGGEQPVDHAGYAVTSIGDSDLDGYPEVAVGAPDASSDTAAICGKVYILYSDAERLEDGSLGDRPFMSGAEKYTRLGSRIFAVGNADSDPYGRADILLGVPFPAPNGDVSTGWAGLVYASPLEWGPGNPKPLRMAFDLAGDNPHWVVEGAQVGFILEGGGTMFGRAATRGPDLDNDGIDDIVIGSPHLVVPEGDDTALPPFDPDENITGAGAIWSFSTMSLEQQMARPVQVAGNDHLARMTGDYNGDHVPWMLDTLSDGRIVASVAERDLGTGGVYILSDLLNSTELGDSDGAYLGEDTAELVGWGMTVVEGIDDDSILAIGSPGWNSSAGRVVLVEEVDEEVPISEAATVTLDGCWHDGQAGSSVVMHPGPDPFGNDDPWLGISSPGASVYASGDGIATIVTTTHLADAADTPCGDMYGTHDPTVDVDGDGVAAPDDCDDRDPAVYPRAPEVCDNGIDEDCDGEDISCTVIEESGCGCAAAGWPGGIGLALVGLIVVRRRKLAAAAALAVSSQAMAHDGDHLEWDVAADTVATIWGSTGFEYLHGPVTSGDYNGDGDADLVIGNYHGITTDYAVGKTYILDHPTVRDSVWLIDADVTILGQEEHDYLGVSVLTITPEEGEADHLAVGANHLGLTENEQGDTFIFRAPLLNLPTVAPAADPDLGLADATLKGDQPGDAFGEQLAEGDVNGDGVLDFAISAPFRDSAEKDELGFPIVPEQGKVWLLHDNRVQDDIAAPVFINTFASASVTGIDSGAAVGWRMRLADLDNDGYDELIIGTLGLDNESFAGELAVFRDLPADPIPVDITDDDGRWLTEERDAIAGHGLDVGDFDGDGDDELLVGSPNFDRGTGRVWLLDGAPDGVEDLDDAAIEVFDGEVDGDGVGFSVAFGPAILLGAPYADRVFVLDEHFNFLGTFVGEGLMGSHVAWVGDFDEDDHDDAVMIAPAMSDKREMQGVAYVLSGERVVDTSFPPLTADPSTVLDDADGDGASAEVDCDDRDPQRAPGLLELCDDGIDNDCDGQVDAVPCSRTGCSHGNGLPHLGWALAALLLVRRR